MMFDNECPLRGMETDAAVDGRAADPSVWLVRPGARGRRSSEKRGEACERGLCTGSHPSGARHVSGRDEHLALHAPALTMALLLEGCCSRSASAAVSMAHVTLARVSAVWGRRASGTAVGGRSSDCAGGCCIAALMRAGRQLPLVQNRESRKKAIRVQEGGSAPAGLHAFITTPWGEKCGTPKCPPSACARLLKTPPRTHLKSTGPTSTRYASLKSKQPAAPALIKLTSRPRSP